eukprot:gnl/Chilomastix_cuspidata/1801.p9 GENE.gnl/Chilomastix_cuspidata/1801~~gnl/Chilomastix_cuspidata/1801.p9  ORF type:complete len:156 (+),score=56.45 gnl/Chilomastix_cuspidata/1801:836-1303(+)
MQVPAEHLRACTLALLQALQEEVPLLVQLLVDKVVRHLAPALEVLHELLPLLGGLVKAADTLHLLSLLALLPVERLLLDQFHLALHLFGLELLLALELLLFTLVLLLQVLLECAYALLLLLFDGADPFLALKLQLLLAKLKLGALLHGDLLRALL